ncbi:MAG: double-strand break repair helicase AddA [Methyloceanibacter sp.]
MSGPRDPLLHAADANQARASDPSASAWVSANAGTGKTEVLVRRGLRLLLAGSLPERILCLTYTKTAAAEMQNRLLKELAAWATASPEDLRSRLEKLLGREPSGAELVAARRLFAITLEARGGLKIFTIHGFCERLLQRFPLESDVTPHFKVLDDTEAILLRRAAFDAVVARAAEHKETALGQALAKIIALAGEEYFRGVVDSVLVKRAELQAMVGLHDGRPDWAEIECASLKRLFGLDQEASDTSLTQALASVLTDADIETLIETLRLHAATGGDRTLKEALESARSAPATERADAFGRAFLTGSDQPRARLCSKGLKQAAPTLCAVLETAQSRYAELHLQRAQLACAEASGALLLLADNILAEYTRAKKIEAVLDYDDLILKARHLLSRAGAAAWVLYKIDGGIDHILVDEAQDTNPEQWSIIERLADEFFAGIGASETLRTLFAVGDEKQSIYSFQGADPARFGAVGRSFRAKALAAERDWNEVPLNLSFRSTPPVLQGVDAVFAAPRAAAGLTWDGTTTIQHHAFRTGEAGLVELWQVETETKPEAAPPFEPWNDGAATLRAVETLCQRIAKVIGGWLTNAEELVAAGRPVRPGDILILVRRRDPFTTPMIRALKRANVPVAGTDRMRLMQQLAVQDLVALADVMLMPEDDLALAVVLKSPLFGFDDDDLFTLAYKRPSSLWDALKAKSEDDPRFGRAADQLALWLSRADFVPPYEFFLELLGEDGQAMRKRILTRLGPEAAEALDEFLDLALAYDREAAPSLQGFVNELRLTDIELKRDMEQERDEVRIMTVHGAKGLQAPIVFLPDTCTLPRHQSGGLYALPRLGEGPDAVAHLVWPAAGGNFTEIDAAKDAVRKADLDEYHRLLYVAMTRARDRLYVCGWQGQRERAEACWHDLVEQGLTGLLVEVEGADGITVKRLEAGQTANVAEGSGAKEAAAVAPPLPDWALAPAAPEASLTALTPSRLGSHLGDSDQGERQQPPLGPRALAENGRFSRGRLVHTLLQYLPEIEAPEQERAARAFIAARGLALSEAMREEIVSETLAIVQDARFAPLFRPGSLGEVPVVARIGAGAAARALSGQIDRLALLDDALLILDYKTNRPPPSAPEQVAPGYVSQLAAYRLALRPLFPGRELRAAIVWTDGPKLMEIPSTLLDDAERRILPRGASLDVGGERT